jgi:solute carrier family 45 protein 1/2/4
MGDGTVEAPAGADGGGKAKQPQISLVGLFLACMVAGGVQYGWALQLSLLTPYVQVHVHLCASAASCFLFV